MQFTPDHHITTFDEILAIKRYGYDFLGDSIDPVPFFNNNFGQFDLLSVLRVIDPALSAVTKTTLFRQIILEDDENPKLEIQIFSEDYKDPETGLALSRSFVSESTGVVVNHEFFRLPRASRRKGISKIVLGAMFQQYVNMGVKKILVHAALEDGGLVWAKQYFMATDLQEVSVILAAASQVLKLSEWRVVRVIYDNYYNKNPAGQAFPIYKWAELPFMEPVLRKSHWHGAVDLTNSVEFSNFVTNAFG